MKSIIFKDREPIENIQPGLVEPLLNMVFLPEILRGAQIIYSTSEGLQDKLEVWLLSDDGCELMGEIVNLI